MAKGSFLGVKRGKLGDAVGYNVANSSDGIKQGWRIYQPVVKNPQTDGQMMQRVKLAAVNNLYRDLKGVIRRSMENKKYGDESRRAWLSMALGQLFEGPWINKGFTLGLPIKGVPISVGSLQQIVCNYSSADGPVDVFLPVSPDSLPYAEVSTIAQLSEILIAAGYLEGDQVTLISGYVPMRAAFSWRIESFYIDASNDETLWQRFGGEVDSQLSINGGTYGDTDGAYLAFQDVYSTPIDVLAVIISRDGQTPGSHLRSTAYFAINDTTAANWYSQGAYEIAKRSYIKTAAGNTNWPVDPGSGEYTPTVQSAFTNANVEFTPVGVRVVNPGQNQYLCIYDADDNNYYIESRENASSSLIVYLTGTGATSTAAPAGKTSANSVDVYSAANVAAGLRAWLIAKGVSPTVLPVRS